MIRDISLRRPRSYILLLLLLLSCLRGAGQAKDSIFLYNGQVLVGKVLAASLGIIIIDDVDFRNTNVKMYKIKRLTTQQRFRIETDDKHIYYGGLKASPDPGRVIIIPDDGSDTLYIDITAINVILPQDKRLFTGLDGKISAGFSYTKSSDVGQVNLSATVYNSLRKLEYRLSASENASIDSSEFSRDREDISLNVGYNIGGTWSAVVGASYQRNLELSIARRYQEILGAGNKLIVRRHIQLFAVSGITFNQEKSTEGESSGLLLEIPLVTRFDFFKFKDPNMQISATNSAYFSVTQKGRIRLEGNYNFAWQIITDFNLNINPYFNFDNQPPSSGSDFDYGLVISLSYRF